VVGPILVRVDVAKGRALSLARCQHLASREERQDPRCADPRLDSESPSSGHQDTRFDVSLSPGGGAISGNALLPGVHSADGFLVRVRLWP